MNSEIENLEQLDEHLVCAMVSGRKRLGCIGIVDLPTANGESRNHALFYDFTQDQQEPLMPVGTITSTAEIEQNFGPWNAFFQSPDFSAWAESITTKQPLTPLAIARTYLCSTGKLQLPDSEDLVRQTHAQKTTDKSLGLGMSQELVESWFQWAVGEDENSRNYSRGRKRLAQVIADAAK